MNNINLHFNWGKANTNIYPVFSRLTIAQYRLNLFKDSINMPNSYKRINKIKKSIKRLEKLINKYRTIIKKVKYNEKLNYKEIVTLKITKNSYDKNDKQNRIIGRLNKAIRQRGYEL